jgi:hypothetical protein
MSSQRQTGSLQGTLRLVALSVSLGLLVIETNLILSFSGSYTSIGSAYGLDMPVYNISRAFVYMLLFLFPNFFQRRRWAFSLLMPCLLFAGVVVILLGSTHVGISIVGIQIGSHILTGLGYCWFLTRYLIYLARQQTMASAIWVVTGALALKTVFGNIITLALDSYSQVIVAGVIVFLCTLMLFVLELGSKPDRPVSERVGKGTRRTLLSQVLIFALTFATMGVMSDWGLRMVNDASAVFIPELAVRLIASVVLVFTFAFLTQVKASEGSFITRNQIAFLIVLAGLLFVSLQNESTDVPVVVYNVVLTVTGVFAHLLLWTAIIRAIRILGFASIRMVAIGEGLNNVACSLWLLFMSEVGPVSNLVIVVVAYILTISITLSARRIHENPKIVERIV